MIRFEDLVRHASVGPEVSILQAVILIDEIERVDVLPNLYR